MHIRLLKCIYLSYTCVYAWVYTMYMQEPLDAKQVCWVPWN